MIAGIVVFDAGVQGSHVNNQSAIHRLDLNAQPPHDGLHGRVLRGRVAGSVLSAKVYAAAGWGACSALAFALIALLEPEPAPARVAGRLRRRPDLGARRLASSP